VIQWRIAISNPRYERGETQGEHPHWFADHMGWELISCDELDTIVEMVNAFFKKAGSALRVYWSMGEIMPAKHEVQQ
jgi:hypothetical protein